MHDEGKDEESEERKRNEKKARTDKKGNNPLQRVAKTECKCGSKDHRQMSLSRCPWKGLLKEEVAWNYEKRLSKQVVPLNCDESMVDPTTEHTSMRRTHTVN
jgi:hypothetical protein